MDQTDLRFINNDSSSSKMYSASKTHSPNHFSSYVNSVTVKNPGSQHIAIEGKEDNQSIPKTSIADENTKIKVGGASIMEPSQQTLGKPLRHLSQGSPSKVNDLVQKLEIQARISKKLDENQRELKRQVKMIEDNRKSILVN